MKIRQLNAVQHKLLEKGIYDIKFVFKLGSLQQLPSSQVAESVEKFLQAYLDGSYTKMERVSVNPAA